MKLSRVDLLKAATVAKEMLIAVAGEDGKKPGAPAPLHTIAAALMMSVGMLHIAANGKLERERLSEVLNDILAGVLDYTEGPTGRKILADTLAEKETADA